MMKHSPSPSFLFPVVAIVTLSFFVSVVNFFGDYSILGNDLNVSGIFWADILKDHFYTWGSYVNTGIFTAINLPQILNALLNIYVNTSSWFGLFILLSGAHFLFYALLKGFYVDIYKDSKRELTLRESVVIFVASLLFLYNFFTLSVLSQPVSSYILFLVFLPLIVLLFNAYLKNPSLKSVIFLSLALSAGLVINLAHFLIILFFLLAILVLHIDAWRSRLLWHAFFSLLLVILFSAYFLIPSIFTEGNLFYGYEDVNAENVDRTVVFSSRYTSFLNLFQLREMVWLRDLHYIYGKISGAYLIFLALLPFIIVSSLVRKSFSEKEKKSKIFYATILIIGLFLAKGYHEPLASMNELFYKFPGAAMFRGNYDKFVLFLIFSFPFLLLISLRSFLSKRRCVFYGLTVSLFLIIIFPFSQKILNPIFKVNIPNDYFDLREEYERKKLDSSLLVFPNYYSNNYVTTDWYKGSDYYPVLLNKKVINELFLYKTDMLEGDIECLSSYSDNQKEVIKSAFPGILNSDAIVVDKTFRERYDDGSDDFLKQLGQTKKEIARRNLDDSDRYIKSESHSYDIYSLKRSFFLPHVYIPRRVVSASDSLSTLPDILSERADSSSIAVYFLEQNSEREVSARLVDRVAQNIADTHEIVEFKKINPTKYRVRIHGAKEEIPLVFSESYHEGWRIFQNIYPESGLDTQRLSHYKVFEDNDKDQASEEELREYVDAGWVTDIGNGPEEGGRFNEGNTRKDTKYAESYVIDFISKNLQGTIQNDNLPDGRFWETWLKDPITSDIGHFRVNGYANGWIIDIDAVCRDEIGMCHKNPDGTYDLEFIIEFSSQKLFYIGSGISLVSLFVCLLYLGYRHLDFPRDVFRKNGRSRKV